MTSSHNTQCDSLREVDGGDKLLLSTHNVASSSIAKHLHDVIMRSSYPSLTSSQTSNRLKAKFTHQQQQNIHPLSSFTCFFYLVHLKSQIISPFHSANQKLQHGSFSMVATGSVHGMMQTQQFQSIFVIFLHNVIPSALKTHLFAVSDQSSFSSVSHPASDSNVIQGT